MRKRLKQALLGLGAALILAAGAGQANAQPANCGDINNDNQITSADLAALAAGTINAACTATNCADLNGSGGVELADQVILGRFLAGGGTKADPGRSAGEQNLLYKLCRGPANSALQACNTAGTPLTGRFASDITIPGPADGCNEFFISGQIVMTNNATLTVNPGVVVKAIVNAANPTLILITRGAHLNANGVTNPIIFTSAATPGTRAPGDWGGIVVNGFAPENIVGPASSEGLPAGPDAAYGGDNPNAFTYQLRFVRIEFSGVIIGEANELNVLTQNSVGRLSILDHVQTNRGKDDGFEWFGGNVRGKFLVSTANGDDGLDWQIGFHGGNDPAAPEAAVQFALDLHDAESVTLSDLDAHGIEADNSEFGANDQPRSAPYFCNITAIGTRDTGAATDTGDGARLRRGTAGRIENSVFEKWRSNGIDLRDNSPIDLAPVISIFDSGTACIANGVVGGGECADTTTAGASVLNGPLTYPGDIAGYCTPVGTLSDNRYLLAAALPAPDDCAAADPLFFSSAPYAGAFDTTTNWLTSDKPCCPSGDPYAVIGGQRCWISFDRS
jgi:hypothetical protein